MQNILKSNNNRVTNSLEATTAHSIDACGVDNRSVGGGGVWGVAHLDNLPPPTPVITRDATLQVSGTLPSVRRKKSGPKRPTTDFTVQYVWGAPLTIRVGSVNALSKPLVDAHKHTENPT
jgi:hypothetical protein